MEQENRREEMAGAEARGRVTAAEAPAFGEGEPTAAAEEVRRQALREFLAADVLDFVEKYPQFAAAERMAELESNRRFRQFCGSRFGREPLAQLYGDFLVIVGEAGTAALARARSKSGRATGGGTAGGAMLSPDQRLALEKWNEEHPEMQMTAREFLSR